MPPVQDPIAEQFGGVAVETPESDPIAAQFGGTPVSIPAVDAVADRQQHDDTERRLYAAEPPRPEERGPGNYPLGSGSEDPFHPNYFRNPETRESIRQSLDPILGAKRAVAGAAALGKIQDTAEQKGTISGTETAQAAHDLISGVFQASGPLIGASAMANPYETVLGLIKAGVAAKVSEKAAGYLTDIPAVQALAGDLGALISGGFSVRDIAKKNLADAADVLRQAKAFDAAHPDVGTPTEPVPVGRGRTEGAREAGPRLESDNADPVAQEFGGVPVAPTPATATDAIANQFGGEAVPERRNIQEVAQRQHFDTRTSILTAAHPDWSQDQIRQQILDENDERKAVLGDTGRKFASTQVQLPPSTAEGLKTIQATIDPKDLGEDGLEDDHHVTLKYGIHADDVAPIREALKDEPPITVTLGKTSIFPATQAGSGQDVVKVDVDSPDLHRLNAKIAAAVPTTDTHPTYQPHATVAYVKAGAGKKYVGDDTLAGQTVQIDHVTFSDTAGNKIEIPLTGERKIGPADGVQNTGEPLPAGVGSVSAGRPDQAAGDQGGALSPEEVKSRKRAKANERRANTIAARKEYAAAVEAAPKEVFDQIIAKAHADGYEGPDEPLHAHLANLLAAHDEFEQEFSGSDYHPKRLLEAIAKYGGISIEKDQQKSELLDLAQQGTSGTSGKHPAFGYVGGVKGVINKVQGIGQDLMLSSLGQDPEFDHITNTTQLQEAIREASNWKPRVGLSVDRFRRGLSQDWWKRLSPPPADETFEDGLSAVRGDDFLDEEGNPKFAKREQPRAPSMFDTLDTGEVQARLPGAEAVRDQDVQTPEFEAPFSLTSEVGKAKASKAPSLFDDTEKPVFAKRVNPKDVIESEGQEEDTYWIYLKRGWKMIDGEHAIAEDTKREARARLSDVVPDEDDDPRFSKREEPAPVFYSALTRAAEDLPQAKGTPEQMAAMLSKAKGVKKEELDWSGVIPWLQGQGRFVTKADIVDYLKANALQVTETLHGPDPLTPEELARYQALNQKMDRWHEAEMALRAHPDDKQVQKRELENTLSDDELDEKETLFRKNSGYHPTKFEQHTLPGGEQYRELLITLPPAKEVGEKIPDGAGGLVAPTVAPTWQRADRAQGDFKGGHFDEPNVLAHLRFNDRTDVDGKKVLFIEEIQSDWLQLHRKMRENLSAQWDTVVDRMKKDGRLTVKCP